MAKVKWTAEDRKTVLDAKEYNRYWNWVKIANTIDYRHTPAACRTMYMNRNPSKKSKRVLPHKRVRENSPPWSLAQRRRMAKLRNRDPPVGWREIAADISTTKHDYHPPKSCQAYYNELMTAGEKYRGMVDAKSEAGEKGAKAYTQRLMRSWIVQRWLPEEEEELIKMCVSRVLPWGEIAETLKRSVTSCQSKWRSLEPLHRVASTKQSKGKVVKSKDKKAAGMGIKSPKKENDVASPQLSPRGFSPGVGPSGA